MSFEGQVAVVTGAGSGIGRAIAVGLAAEGATVVAADRDLDGAKKTAEIAGSGRVEPHLVDVTDPGTVTALRDEVVGRHGAPHVLVNAAGWDRIAPFLEGDEEFWRTLVEINYLGQVRVTRAFVEPMLARGGRVVNLASDAGRVGSMGETVYAGTKGGVIAFTKSLAREVARHGVTVNCVCPGPTDTPLFAAQPERIREALVKAIPLRRMAAPEEVADAVLFFASDRAAFVTGQVLSVSGGLTMAG
ncbi:SDR family NAD(P)-dependent oxidoreductase [Pseudonocardia sp. GCM10023141]|uniref:SDR family NAD(P)-dependent oxidoreductase n=1 Tax=Pseudonocardia sp. GCM10023141 TaxID=3252653 RepID=UPI00361BF524